MTNGCEHDIQPGNSMGTGERVYGCVKCGMEFVPADALNVALDGIAGTMSAVLWDYSERMHNKYGLAPKELDVEPPTCEDQNVPHDYDEDGVCRNCQRSPFLGSGQKG